MELSEIATIAGKPGLYKILQPTRNGMILESIDEKRVKTVAGPTSRVSILKEISIYTLNKDGAIPLGDALHLLYKKYGLSIPIAQGASNDEYFKVVTAAITDLNLDKVYASDLKKLISWYHILAKYSPEILQAADEAASTSEAAKPAQNDEVPAPTEQDTPAKSGKKKK